MYILEEKNYKTALHEILIIKLHVIKQTLIDKKDLISRKRKKITLICFSIIQKRHRRYNGTMIQ